jgi:3-oxoadipate enol-lactonase/4-carboxymuconolactone decarboxylase
LKDVFERNDARGYVACCAAIRDADFRDAIARIGVPTLVISGNRDLATTSADGRLLAACIPAARHVEIDSAHLSNIERPAEFDAALMSFLREESRKPA